jgi:hypothetical protein
MALARSCTGQVRGELVTDALFPCAPQRVGCRATHKACAAGFDFQKKVFGYIRGWRCAHEPGPGHLGCALQATAAVWLTLPLCVSHKLHAPLERQYAGACGVAVGSSVPRKYLCSYLLWQARVLARLHGPPGQARRAWPRGNHSPSGPGEHGVGHGLPAGGQPGGAEEHYEGRRPSNTTSAPLYFHRLVLCCADHREPVSWCEIVS